MFGTFVRFICCISAICEFSYVLFLLYLHCCTDYMDNRQVLVLCTAFLCLISNWLMLFLYCIILPLCHLLKLNDNDDLMYCFFFMMASVHL